MLKKVGFSWTKASLLSAVCVGLMVANASSVQASEIYATQIDWDPGGGATPIGGQVGNGFDGNGTAGESTRGDPDNALGTEDGNFLSLGLGGLAVFGFDQDFTGPGSVFEVTFNCSDVGGTCVQHPEQVRVWTGTTYAADGSFDITGFSDQGTVQNGDAQDGATVTIGGNFTYLALADESSALGEESFDGFDVDAVSVTEIQEPDVDIPVPATLGLLGAGLIGVGVAMRRRKD